MVMYRSWSLLCYKNVCLFLLFFQVLSRNQEFIFMYFVHYLHNKVLKKTVWVLTSCTRSEQLVTRNLFHTTTSHISISYIVDSFSASKLKMEHFISLINEHRKQYHIPNGPKKCYISNS